MQGYSPSKFFAMAMVLFSESVLRWAHPDSMVPPGIISLILFPKILEANWSSCFLQYIKSHGSSKRVLVSLTPLITLFVPVLAYQYANINIPLLCLDPLLCFLL